MSMRFLLHDNAGNFLKDSRTTEPASFFFLSNAQCCIWSWKIMLLLTQNHLRFFNCTNLFQSYTKPIHILF